MGQRIFVDANVFFSKTLMDWLFHFKFANPGMFETCATWDVFAEVLAHMRKYHPTAGGQVTAHRLTLMQRATGETIQDYPGGLPFSGKDPNDYHVHAAATAARCDIVLTCNDPKDFTSVPDAELYNIMHPDDFFMFVVDSKPDCLETVVRRQLAYWNDRPSSRKLDEALRRAGCVTFAERVGAELKRIALLP